MRYATDFLHIMKTLFFGVLAGLAFLIGKRQVTEEPDTPDNTTPVQDTVVTVIDEPQNDSLIPEFCPLNPANNAFSIHFRLNEFHSKDGIAVPVPVRGNVQELIQELEIIRAYFGGRPIIITSGYRSPTHNALVGGTSDSKHLCGMAADFIIQDIPAGVVQEGLEYLISTGEIHPGGLGKYSSFTHYDIGERRTWYG